jgi:hypothetical protein
MTRHKIVAVGMSGPVNNEGFFGKQIVFGYEESEITEESEGTLEEFIM